MAEKKRSGGPNTNAGKARSSQNALKLGFSSMSIANSDEKQVVDEYVSQLTDYYKPESPLEILQIQRISICRAKLARLYDVELSRISLAKSNIETNPELILEQMQIPKGYLRSLVLDGIRHGSIVLPYGLNEETLASLIKEVRQYLKKTTQNGQKIGVLPLLEKYLQNYECHGVSNSDSMDERLENFLTRINRSINTDAYLGSIEDVSKEISHQKMLKTTNPSGRIGKFLARGIDYEDGDDLINNLELLLPLLVHLEKLLQEAKSLLMRYSDAKTLLIQSAMLPQGEADLLMRYQTTLERRLSSSVGELLELQKRRN